MKEIEIFVKVLGCRPIAFVMNMDPNRTLRQSIRKIQEGVLLHWNLVEAQRQEAQENEVGFEIQTKLICSRFKKALETGVLSEGAILDIGMSFKNKVNTRSVKIGDLYGCGFYPSEYEVLSIKLPV